MSDAADNPFASLRAEQAEDLRPVEELNPAELVIFLQDDQRTHWHAGERVLVESYLEEYPALWDDDGGVLELIFNEIVLRQVLGEQPDVDEYLRRFPQYKSQFEHLVAVQERAPVKKTDSTAKSIVKNGPQAPTGSDTDPSVSELPPAEPLSGSSGTIKTPSVPPAAGPARPATPSSGTLRSFPLLSIKPASFTLRGQSAPPPVQGSATSPGSDTPRPPTPPSSQTPPLPGKAHPPGSPATHRTISGGKGAAPKPAGPGWPRIPGYDIMSELGKGGMGVVYKARQVQLRRLVALKMIRDQGSIDPEDLVRFQTEAQALATLQHPNIVQIYDIGEHNGLPFFSLEFVEGGALDKRLSGEPQPPRDAAQLMECLARAMHAAHEKNVIHRDLKPANILLAIGSREGGGSGSNPSSLKGDKIQDAKLPLSSYVPKITDFGLAKQLDEDSGQTKSGAVMGTPSYMAPEQAQGKLAEVNHLTDVWALGTILYELMTGRPPFRGATAYDTIDLVCNADPVAPRQLQPKLPRDLETICLKCLEKEKKKRYATAAEMADDLRRYLDGEAIHARPVGVAERSWRWCKRHRAASIAASIVFVVVVAAGTVGTVLYQQAQEAKKQQLAVDAKAKQDEADRLEAHNKEVDQKRIDLSGQLGRAALQYEQGKYDVAYNLYEGVIDQTKDLPELKTLGDQAHAQKQKVDERLAAIGQQKKFGPLEDAALFEALAPTAKGLTERQKAVQNGVLKALASLDVSLKLEGGKVALQSEAPLDLEKRRYTAPEAQEFSERCCELLMLLAGAVVEQPGDREAQLREALDILDRAHRLVPAVTLMRSYHNRKARYLRLLAEELKTRKAPQARDTERSAQMAEAEARKVQPATARDFFLLGDDLYRPGDIEQARDQFEASVNHASVDRKSEFWPRYFLAICYLQEETGTDARLRQQFLVRARDHLNTCLNIAPPQARVWTLLLRGFVYGHLGAFKNATADFAEALKLGTSDGNTEALYALYNNRGILNLRDREENEDDQAYAARIQEGMADLRRAIQTRPDQWKAYLSLAKAYADHKRAQEAEEQFRNALRVAEEQFQKGELDAYTLCVLYRNRGAIHQELIRAREHQLGTQGKDVKKDPELQQYYQAAFDDYKAAIHAIERDTGGKVPTDSFEKEGLARAHFDRGRLYQRRAEYQKAVDEFNAVLNADPPSSLIHRLAVYRWRGDAQYQQDKYAAAVASYDQYLKTGSLSNAVGGLLAFGSDTILPPLTPIMVRRQFLQGGRTLADAFRARGFCHTKLDNFAAAIEDYSAAAELDPDAWNTYSLRGRAYLALAVYPLAGLDFDRAILLHPRDSDLYTGRGSARVKMGRMIPEGLQDAEDALKWAAQADQAARDAQQPNRMTASQWATLYYQAARIYAQAVDQLDKAVQRGEPPDSARRARYRDRGLALLLRAVDANEPRQRARFWQVTIQPDRDLEPLRGPEFVRLQEQYGRSVADLAREVDEAVRLAPHDQRVLLEGARTYANLAYTLFWQAYRGDAQARQRMDQYEDRALVLIRQALDSSPAGERPSLWHDKVELDRAFDRLRTLPRYRALVREFGQGINTAVR